jgi:hypothetical protein
MDTQRSSMCRVRYSNSDVLIKLGLFAIVISALSMYADIDAIRFARRN